MRLLKTYVFLLVCLCAMQLQARTLQFEFLGDTLRFTIADNVSVPFDALLSEETVRAFNLQMEQSDYEPLMQQMKLVRDHAQLNDWLYYQLIRRVAQQISPKQDDYHRYTLYKWFLLCHSGYDATLSLSSKHLLFYVRTEDNIYGIPFYEKEGRQYVCLNYHDYGKIDFATEIVKPVDLHPEVARNSFSYRITQMPNFKPDAYAEKELQFSYKGQQYHFKIKLNPEVNTLFNNYPVSDFGSYFNIPLSRETYSSLIPELRTHLKDLSQQEGVDYLMRFTRYAFLYKNDQQQFGKEKRMSPEQTLLYEESDCDDRASLFFYLVKEIYNLPMIAMLYPTHITVAVQFDKPVGKAVVYQGETYSICEPTPMGKDLKLGQGASHLKHQHYEVVYAYHPSVQK